MTDGGLSSLSDNEFEQLVDNKETYATKQVINKAVKVMENYCTAKETTIDVIKGFNAVELNKFLTRHYAEVRKVDGELYAKKSMQTHRFGLRRYFVNERGFDIVKDSEFKEANGIFQRMLVELKKAGKGSVIHKSPILPSDMLKIQASPALDQRTPRGLQNKVFIDIMIHICNRGRENLRRMTKQDFTVEVDANGEKFVNNRSSRDRMTKISHGEDGKESHGGLMYATPDKQATCPVRSFEKYVAALNPKSESFWQRPIDQDRIKDQDTVWYDNVAVGKNKLYTKAKEISIEAGCSKEYTNHCLRSTNVRTLDTAGFKARDIMSISGHMSEATIRSYSKTSRKKKRDMSHTLSSLMTSTVEEVIGSVDDGAVSGPSATTTVAAPHSPSSPQPQELPTCTQEETILKDLTNSPVPRSR